MFSITYPDGSIGDTTATLRQREAVDDGKAGGVVQQIARPVVRFSDRRRVNPVEQGLLFRTHVSRTIPDPALYLATGR
jgi:hypothetical protein